MMEFQAIIMAAGGGSRMTDLTCSTPKALLPVGNMPLVWYPVQMLEKAGFKEALVVTFESTKEDIRKALVEICAVKMPLDFVVIPDDADYGTADTLRHIKDRIKSDFLVVSCDLITDLQLHLLADVHRTHDATVTMLLSSLPDVSEVSVPGGKANKKLEHDFVGLDEQGNRILFFSSEADFEETLSLRKRFLKRHPFISMRTRLMDGHLYFMKKWVVDYLLKDRSVSSIKGELIPLLVKKQFSRSKTTKNGVTNPDIPTDASSAETKPDILSFAAEDEDDITALARDMSFWNDHHGDMEKCYHGDKIRCYSYIMEGGYCLRANTLVTYCEANRQITRHLSSLASSQDLPFIHPSANLPQRPQIGAESMVGEGSTIGDKVSVKKSVIGKHCTVAEKVKVTNCVLMDHVNIAEGCTLSGCVICENVQISEKCELKDCLVGARQRITTMGKFTNEAIVDVDRMMEI